ncbi:ABC transporter ATP-binding protein [Streptomyces sp. NPDC004658]|uniref:ABC transporter ATP-binding protein n=1 Tax=Streptomyces sp. NPDC004658 TaxID=3154672 RepID=UPI0033BFA237
MTELDLTIAEGECIGFLGPNGAGKTTVMRMLTTLLRPSAGTAKVAGFDLLRQPRQIRRHIGYVAQNSGLSPESTVAEELVIQGRLHGFSKKSARLTAEELAEILEFGDLMRRTTKTLSGGQRRRVDIALSLAHGPSVLFLDEPTTGLDPQSRANLWAHIRRLHHHLGVTVFLTTHYLDEADALADRLLIMDGGRIVADGAPDALKSHVGEDTLTLRVPSHVLDEAATAIRSATGVADVDVMAEDCVRAKVSSSGVVPEVISALEAAGVSATSLHVQRPTLDEVFLQLTGRTLTGDAGHQEDGVDDAA